DRDPEREAARRVGYGAGRDPLARRERGSADARGTGAGEPRMSVVAVSLRAGHHFSKTNALFITLIAGIGVEGDGHAGATVQHRSRLALFAKKPNLRQVHLIHEELFDELRAAGFTVRTGDLGENVTTRGLDLLALPTGTRLRLGLEAVVELTGLRNPCV